MRVMGFTGGSGAGKTTLLEKLIPEMTRRGLRVSVIKHAHHGFDMDKPMAVDTRKKLLECERMAGELVRLIGERAIDDVGKVHAALLSLGLSPSTSRGR